MSRINRTQSYAALWLNHLGWPVEKISNELEITDNQVLGVIKKEKEQGSSSAIKTASSSTSTSKSKHLMITDSANNKNNVAIMTKEASALNDDFKKQNPPTTENRFSKNIFRINE